MNDKAKKNQLEWAENIIQQGIKEGVWSPTKFQGWTEEEIITFAEKKMEFDKEEGDELPF